MMKRFVGIVLLMLSLVACGGVELPQGTSTMAPATSIHTPSENAVIPATEDVLSLEDIKSVPTQRPTKDPLVTYTVTPIPTQVPSFSNVRLTHDLVWLDRSGTQRGHLMRWDATKNIIEILAGINEESLIALPGKVTDFDLKANTVLVSLQVVDDLGEYFELGSIDLDTGEYLPLLNTANSLSTFSKINEVKLSPNGRWAAYVLSETPVGTTNTSGLIHELNVLRISSASVPVLFASCEKGGSETTCIEALIWSPDNSMLAWHGPGGMWMANLEEGSELKLPDFFGENDAHDLRYYPDSWSLDNRYLEIQVWGHEGGYKGLYDWELERYIIVPNTYTYAGAPYSETSWLPNGRLLVIESSYQVFDRIVSSKIFAFSIDTDIENDWLYLTDTYELEAEIGDKLIQDGQFDSQKFEFVRIRRFEKGAPRDSLLLQTISYDLRSDDITVHNEFEFFEFTEEYDGYWVYGNLTGASHNQSYIFEYRGDVIYMSSDGVYAAAIQDLFGSDACCFAWIDN